MKQKKFAIVTLGCRTNQYESQAYASQLRKLGYTELKEGEGAEICIVNTCTVTASADAHSRLQIRQICRQHPGAKVVVTGCLAELDPQEIQKIPGVSAVVSNKDKENLLSVIFPEESLPEFVIDYFSAHTRAFVKVQDGCNSFCTYCVIPYVRGRSRSREIEEIVIEIKNLVANGYQEVVLTGINIGDFKTLRGEKLVDLVKAIDRIDGLSRIRISSIDPDEIDEDLISAVIDGEKTCNSFHMVLQSGSNSILKRMNRKYTKQMFLHKAMALREIDPNFTITTDIIVGFPGETEIDFQETLDVMEKVQFAKVHMFPYSPRQRTRAALFLNRVPHPVMEQRKQIVLRHAEKIAFSMRDSYIGKRVKVLMESDGFGHTENFLPVRCCGKENTIVEVECIGNREDGLFG
jgi:threonylcarbamoyladenosine tRNA methylthiotransferase MtaB